MLRTIRNRHGTTFWISAAAFFVASMTLMNSTKVSASPADTETAIVANSNTGQQIIANTSSTTQNSATQMGATTKPAMNCTDTGQFVAINNVEAQNAAQQENAAVEVAQTAQITDVNAELVAAKIDDGMAITQEVQRDVVYYGAAFSLAICV